ncbi:MAG: LptF/LptG family permease, partial [Alcaligenaceae bacterium]
DDTRSSWAQFMWRVSLPLAALNLALLAIPLGAVNPRMGRTGDLLISGLIALLYMNLINLSRSWISSDRLDFKIGVWLVHAIFALLTIFLLRRRLRVKAPRDKGGTTPAAAAP